MAKQHGKEQEKKISRHPTTPPLPYDNKVRFGALNVQGIADTLKLKILCSSRKNRGWMYLVILSGMKMQELKLCLDLESDPFLWMLLR